MLQSFYCIQSYTTKINFLNIFLFRRQFSAWHNPESDWNLSELCLSIQFPPQSERAESPILRFNQEILLGKTIRLYCKNRMKQTHYVDKIQPSFNAVSAGTFGNRYAFNCYIISSPKGSHTTLHASAITRTGIRPQHVDRVATILFGINYLLCFLQSLQINASL
jgi:hypothetical protein